MDDFSVRIDPPNSEQGDLVVKVLINGQIVTDYDYCLDIDTFFSAIGLSKSQVELIGGCGIPECCATGYPTYSRAYSWKWGDFDLSWTDVHKAASQIIAAVEELPQQKKTCEHFRTRLPYYRKRLEELKELAEMAPGLVDYQ
jgi:hypothetical protein